MLLSTFIGKQLSLHEKLKGVCVGLSLASKSKKIKGFLCKEDGLTFLLPFTNVDYVTDKIRLKKFTPLPAPKSEVFTPFLPVYDENGVLLGRAVDLIIQKQTAAYLLLDDGKRIPAPHILCVGDAVILKKAPAYPLSCPIPITSFPLLEKGFDKDCFVTKKALLSAAKKGNLIKFTLSLAPFSALSNGVLSGEL